MLAQRNAHLAREIVQRAVSHRNRRLPLSRLLCSALTLQAADLGLEAAGLPSLLALRQAVQAEVDELVGMAPLKRFLQELRSKVEYVTLTLTRTLTLTLALTLTLTLTLTIALTLTLTLTRRAGRRPTTRRATATSASSGSAAGRAPRGETRRRTPCKGEAWA